MLFNKYQWILFAMILILVTFLLYLIISQAREYYQTTSEPMLNNVLEILQPLHPIMADITFAPGNKSYTINKKKIYLCLKDKKGNYYSKNMLVYVAIHELSHVLCDEIGHTDKFNTIFDGLLEKAAKLGIYNPSIPLEDNYCE